jgi:hypothetical protein
MRRAEIVQSIRAGLFGGFVVLGSQYRDEIGELRWYVALLPELAPGTRIYHVTAGEMPNELTGAACGDRSDQVVGISACF